MSRIALFVALPLLMVAADQPNLSGSWKLNAGQSDDARAKMMEAMGGGGPAGRPARQRPEGARPGGPPAGGRGMMEAPESMKITQAGDEVTFDYGRGQPLVLKTDGSTQEQEGPRSAVKTTAKWEDGALVVARDMGRFKTTSKYTVSADGKQLTVTRETASERFTQPLVVKSVYDKE